MTKTALAVYRLFSVTTMMTLKILFEKDRRLISFGICFLKNCPKTCVTLCSQTLEAEIFAFNEVTFWTKENML